MVELCTGQEDDRWKEASPRGQVNVIGDTGVIEEPRGRGGGALPKESEAPLPRDDGGANPDENREMLRFYHF